MYQEIVDHQLEGVMFHSDLHDLYCFLGLNDFVKWQEKELTKELASLKRTIRYYIKTNDKLIEATQQSYTTKVITDQIKKHHTYECNFADVQRILKESLEQLEEWEQNTHKFLKECKAYFIDKDCIVGEFLVKDLCHDVKHELETIQSVYNYLVEAHFSKEAIETAIKK